MSVRLRARTASVAVAQFPDTSRLNPAIDLYREALESSGVAVRRHSLYPHAEGKTPRLTWSWLWSQRGTLDVVHLHYFQRLYLVPRSAVLSAGRLAGLVAKLTAARLLGVQVAWTAHNLYPHERPWPWLDRAARRAVTRLAGVVFVASPDAGTTVVETFPRLAGKVTVARHGHYCDVYGDARPRLEARRSLGLADDAFVFLTFGLVRAYKGVERLIDTFVREFSDTPAVLVVAGDPHTPDMRSRLRAAAGEHGNVLAMLGHVPAEDVPTVFGASDVVVLPFEESFVSGSAILACSMGRPVILPRTPVLTGAPTECVYQYEPGDRRALVHAMRESMSVDSNHAGEAALAFVRGWDWETTGSAMADAFREIAHRTGRRGP